MCLSIDLFDKKDRFDHIFSKKVNINIVGARPHLQILRYGE